MLLEDVVAELDELVVHLVHDAMRGPGHGPHDLVHEMRVLLEETDREGRWTGFADNYVRVAIAGDHPEFIENQLVTVRITDAPDDSAVVGELIESP